MHSKQDTAVLRLACWHLKLPKAEDGELTRGGGGLTREDGGERPGEDDRTHPLEVGEGVDVGGPDHGMEAPEGDGHAHDSSNCHSGKKSVGYKFDYT